MKGKKKKIAGFVRATDTVWNRIKRSRHELNNIVKTSDISSLQLIENKEENRQYLKLERCLGLCGIHNHFQRANNETVYTICFISDEKKNQKRLTEIRQPVETIALID